MDHDETELEACPHAELIDAHDTETAAADEGTIAERIAGRRRAPAAVVAPDLLEDPTSTPFVLYLCSGSERDDDLGAHLRDDGVAAIQIDYERGGIGDDLARDDVADRT
eukprot:1664013-Pleurochrysis_carterae.AAC.1